MKGIGMTIRKKRPTTEMVLDLTGPQGNAFYLLATARKLARECGIDQEEIYTEMKSGDYEHLVKTFDKYFGHIVVLER